ncbi:zinc ribbon domain-containing protein [Burkholderia cenocepacia]|uniref:zinc ribbon domain-containing protein n=1 Tax=Burkholderia cenocepacia TaxID=95486 RepID=UPI0020196670|nr:zinc ribbon domain-containing protein [Burkholderia cenocepacia]MCO1396411.1 zinc ribbon domain-containing protein [Burkholderia cenocepacia]MCO1408985.1 zinc ribbon domain-containing protein [Burkholderia cenocepacia]UQN92040.1 zinc ribbon domain-containing protein [Burkholderia cenocepacia]UQN99189.1 zinc ribbon domain-containing protein [Burkholderia cenocepacia]UQP50856.1 zinc ribbon domain-containing protein [Burkholderia cenocepacia]
MARKIVAPYVAPDIGPYQAVAVDVATGKPPVINSRSAHREFLKRNGYVEVGNESVGRKAGEVRGDFNLRGELTSATREVLGKTR